MKPTRAIFVLTAMIALVAVATGRADDAPAPGAPKTIAIGVKTTLVKGEQGKPVGDRKTQVPQYNLAAAVKAWGFGIESRVQTAWDKALTKSGVVVNLPAPPPKEGEKPPEKKDPKAPEKKDDKKGGPDFLIEGTIELEYTPLKFWDDKRELAIIYVETVKVKIKDAAGKELKAISWADTWGTNNDKGHDYVMGQCELRAARFLVNDLMHVKEIADLVPAANKPDFEKNLKDEDEFRSKNFDDATTKKSATSPAPKGDDEKK
jgi:hypothetical protein